MFYRVVLDDWYWWLRQMSLSWFNWGTPSRFFPLLFLMTISWSRLLTINELFILFNGIFLNLTAGISINPRWSVSWDAVLCVESVDSSFFVMRWFAPWYSSQRVKVYCSLLTVESQILYTLVIVRFSFSTGFACRWVSQNFYRILL